MPNALLSIAQVREEVQTMLGSSGVAVELSNNDFLLCFRRALRKLNTHRPGRGVVKLVVNSSQKRYEISPVPAGLKGIRRVEFVEEPLPSSVIDPFNPLTYHPAPTTLTGVLTPGDVAQEADYRESARRVMGLDPVSRWQWEGTHLYIYVDIPTGVTYLCCVEFVFHYMDAVGVPNGIDMIPDVDADWILEYCTAQGKQILGRIRKKFGGIADDQGGVGEVDGSDLVTEGREDEKELLDALKRRRRPLLPVTAR